MTWDPVVSVDGCRHTYVFNLLQLQDPLRCYIQFLFIQSKSLSLPFMPYNGASINVMILYVVRAALIIWMVCLRWPLLLRYYDIVLLLLAFEHPSSSNALVKLLLRRAILSP